MHPKLGPTKSNESNTNVFDHIALLKSAVACIHCAKNMKEKKKENKQAAGIMADH